MIDPINIKKVLIDNTELDILVINNIPIYDAKEYDIFSEKEFPKFINDIEKTVRTSFEYRQMITYMRQNLDMNQCAFFKNVNNIDSYNIKIEIHHSPFTLYDICIIVFNKRIANGEIVEVEAIAKEVMFLHYRMMVGLIPLSETVHELVHNGYLFVPIDKVYGHFKEFYNMYEPYMTAEQIDVIDRIIEMSQFYNETEHAGILNKKYIYVDVSGEYDLPQFNQILNQMSQKIDEIKRSQGLSYDKPNNNKLIKPISFTEEA